MVNWFATTSHYIISSINTVQTILPLTVIAAIILFFIKEVIEWVRRHKAASRKKVALSSLLARECELNHWSIKSMRKIIETIRDESAVNTDAKFHFTTLKSGKILFRAMESDSDFIIGMPLAKTHNELMSKNLLEVATLDKGLYAAMQPAYDAIADMEHIRQSLIYYVEPEDELGKQYHKEHLEGFIDYALSELENAYQRLNLLYKVCTGEELSSHKMR